jgi:hypothetical protein
MRRHPIEDWKSSRAVLVGLAAALLLRRPHALAGGAGGSRSRARVGRLRAGRPVNAKVMSGMWGRAAAGPPWTVKLG